MGVLTIQHLSKSFETPEGGLAEIIRIPSFELESGEQVALEGGSGSGKTTFLNLIAGILTPDSGVIRIAGEEMSFAPEAERDAIRARRIGYVFQTFNLLQGYTALENVELAMRFGKGVDRAAATNLLERVGLKDRLHYRPRQLSVGQQQRVAVARALANSPELVLADEPTGNLDHVRAGEALELIRGICAEKKAALLLVSHDREILGRFEKVMKLEELNLACQRAEAKKEGAPS